MSLRTDLAVEATAFVKTRKALLQQTKRIKNIEIVQIEIKNKVDEKILNRPKGTYITISTQQLLAPEKREDVHHVLVRELKSFVRKKKSVLIVGLGNKNICSDSIGPRVVEKIFATRHIKKELINKLGFADLPSVCTIAPGVLGQTGMETAEIVKALAEKTKPNLIVVVDALAAGLISRLGTTIQLTNAGIAPGSGVSNRRAELSQKVLQVPVLAVGMPTVVDLKSIMERDINSKTLLKCKQNMMVTPKNVDEIVNNAGDLIANALNCAIFPMFSQQELEVLSS